MEEKRFTSTLPIDQLVETTRRLIRRKALPNLKKILEKAYPVDIATLLKSLGLSEREITFGLIDNDKLAAEILVELSTAEITPLLSNIELARLQRLLKNLADDDATDLFAMLPQETREELLSYQGSQELASIEELIHYRQDSAGGLMTPEYLAIEEQSTAAEAISKVQQAKDAETVFYLYVVDKENNLVGVLSLRQLLTANPQRLIKEIMIREIVRVKTDTDQKEVAEIVSRYDLLAVPVVDENNKLIGIITVDDVIDVLSAEATEDMAIIAGVAKNDVQAVGSWWQGVVSRLPWLAISFLAGIALLFLYREKIAIGLLPLLLLLVIGLGNQSAAVFMTSLEDKHLNRYRFAKIFLREISISLFFSLFFSLIIFSMLFFIFSEQFLLSITIFLAFIIALLFSTISSSLLPAIFFRLKIDPAVAAGQLLTAVNFIISLIVYYIFLAQIDYLLP